jgi:hypothetical protein
MYRKRLFLDTVKLFVLKRRTPRMVLRSNAAFQRDFGLTVQVRASSIWYATDVKV